MQLIRTPTGTGKGNYVKQGASRMRAPASTEPARLLPFPASLRAPRVRGPGRGTLGLFLIRRNEGLASQELFGVLGAGKQILASAVRHETPSRWPDMLSAGH